MYLQDDKVYIAQTTCGTIEIPLTGEDINSICTSGPNDLAVEYVCSKPSLRNWMTQYSKELIREEVRDYGNWTEEELAKAGKIGRNRCHTKGSTLQWGVSPRLII